jgi:hypothetical protein
MRTLQIIVLALAATVARADVTFSATTGNAIVTPDPWDSGPATASSNLLTISVDGPEVDTDSMQAVIVPGLPESNGLYFPGGSFLIQLGGGGVIQGTFTGEQAIRQGICAPPCGPGASVDFTISPDLLTFTGGADLFSGQLLVRANGVSENFISLTGVSVPEPSTLLLLATAGLALCPTAWSRSARSNSREQTKGDSSA